MNGLSPYRLLNPPNPYLLPPEPPSTFSFLESHTRVNSFDSSHLQPYPYLPPPPMAGESILSNMREELSFVKSDLQELMRAEKDNENALMMERLQILNHELRREVSFMKEVEERLKIENKVGGKIKGGNGGALGIDSRGVNQQKRSKSSYFLPQKVPVGNPSFDTPHLTETKFKDIPPRETHTNNKSPRPEFPSNTNTPNKTETSPDTVKIKIHPLNNVVRLQSQKKQMQQQILEWSIRESELMTDVLELKASQKKAGQQHQEQIYSLTNQNQRLKKQIGEMQSKHNSITLRYQQLDHRYRHLSDQFNAYKVNTKQQIQERKGSATNNQDLIAARNRVSDLQLVIQKQKREIASLTLKLNHQSNQSQSMDNQKYRTLQNRMEEVLRDNVSIRDNYQRKINILNASILSSKGELEQLRNRFTRVQTRNNELVSLNEKLVADLEGEREMINRLQSQLRSAQEGLSTHNASIESNSLHRKELLLKDQVLSEMTKSSEKLEFEVQLSKSKHQELENQINIKNIYISQLNETYQGIKGDLQRSKQYIVQLKKEIERLQGEIEKLEGDRTNQVNEKLVEDNKELGEVVSKQVEELQFYQTGIAKLEEELGRCRSELKQSKKKGLELESNLTNRTNYILTLEKELGNNHEMEQSLAKIKYLEAQLADKQTTIEVLETESRRSRTKIQGESSQNVTIQQILKTNTLKDTEIMNSLRAKTQQIIGLKSTIEEYKRKMDLMKNHADIDKLKLTTEERNQKSHYQVQIQNLKSELEGNKKKLETLSKKLEIKIDELGKKDEFMQKVIMNKARKEEKGETEEILGQLEGYFGRSYLQRLQQAEEEIERMKGGGG